MSNNYSIGILSFTPALYLNQLLDRLERLGLGDPTKVIVRVRGAGRMFPDDITRRVQYRSLAGCNVIWTTIIESTPCCIEAMSTFDIPIEPSFDPGIRHLPMPNEDAAFT
jgi:hypothetical protein